MSLHSHWMLTVSRVAFLGLGYAARNSRDADLRPSRFSVWADSKSQRIWKMENFFIIYGGAWLDWVNGKKKLVILNRLWGQVWVTAWVLCWTGVGKERCGLWKERRCGKPFTSGTTKGVTMLSCQNVETVQWVYSEKGWEIVWNRGKKMDTDKRHLLACWPWEGWSRRMVMFKASLGDRVRTYSSNTRISVLVLRVILPP